MIRNRRDLDGDLKRIPVEPPTGTRWILRNASGGGRFIAELQLHDRDVVLDKYGAAKRPYRGFLQAFLGVREHAQAHAWGFVEQLDEIREVSIKLKNDYLNVEGQSGTIKELQKIINSPEDEA